MASIWGRARLRPLRAGQPPKGANKMDGPLEMELNWADAIVLAPVPGSRLAYFTLKSIERRPGEFVTICTPNENNIDYLRANWAGGPRAGRPAGRPN